MAKKVIEKEVFQIMDVNCRYRSFIKSTVGDLEFISKNRGEAIIYTYNEAKKIAKYYTEERKIPVMIECRIAKKKKEI